MSDKPLEDLEQERVLDRLVAAMETFSGDQISRARATDLLEALNLNGLDIVVNEN